MLLKLKWFRYGNIPNEHGVWRANRDSGGNEHFQKLDAPLRSPPETGSPAGHTELFAVTFTRPHHLHPNNHGGDATATTERNDGHHHLNPALTPAEPSMGAESGEWREEINGFEDVVSRVSF